MRFNSLQAWLDWQQTLTPNEIELGLARVGEVYRRLKLGPLAKQVVTVAGTNGKGSTVAYYEAWLASHGYRVGSYTSPHLIRYNERIRLNRDEVSDDALCVAFDRIDQARGEIPLTYFEFGTLAALVLISEFQPDVAILEVGLGGRLDATNIIDADLAHITRIGLDHQDWLGSDRDTIGFEKAGIFRPGQKVVINDPDPPQSVLDRAEELNCHSARVGVDYQYQVISDGRLSWQGKDDSLICEYALTGSHQALNLAGVVSGLVALGLLTPASTDDGVADFRAAQIRGRLQRVTTWDTPQLWLDVGHNEDAAQVLSEYFSKVKQGRRLVVMLGMLADKDQRAFVQQLKPVVDEWWAVSLDTARGLSANALCERISSQVTIEKCFENAEQALAYAMSSLGNQDILVATGSFFTVEAVLQYLD